MKKQTKIIIVLIVVSVFLFALLNIFFPYDSSYYSLEQCEKNFQKSLSDGELVLRCNAPDIVFEAWVNEENELYIAKILSKDSIFMTKYKVAFSKGYFIEKALNYYIQTGNILWTNAPEININPNNDVFSWCITDKNTEQITDTYVPITFNGEEYLLFYKITNN